MAEVANAATPGPLPSDSIHFCGGAVKVGPLAKSKTPSELRGELLKRRKSVEHVDESPPFLQDLNMVGLGPSKPDPPKNTRYTEMRLDDVYPVKKPTSRLRLLSGKGAAKKANGSRFRGVAELSLGSRHFSDTTTVDMDKALKGVATREPCNCALSAVSSEKCADLKSTFSGTLWPEVHVPGRKVPLDFTLKTTMRIVSSSSLNWLYRLLMSGSYCGMMLMPSQFNCVSKYPFTVEADGANSLQSWIYPQSSLPSSIISALSSATGAVCTSLFVVMFMAVGDVGKTKRKCNAYITQSTRGLRALFREHDICFSMPLCSSEVEEISMEDIELSEMEKHNLGQTKRLSSTAEVDNSPNSLLAFFGNESVHGLYDFLLNYKSFLTSLTSSDVPVLCSPTPFRNAAPSAPEVRCKEIKIADHLASQSRASATKDGESIFGSSGGVCYSIEVTDVYLTPWVVSSVCAAMASEGKSFQASFTTSNFDWLECCS